MKSGLLEIRSFIIPVGIVAETLQFLREVGQRGSEGFVLWSGIVTSSNTFRFTRAVVPRQSATTTSHGLLVTVDGESLFEVNKMLHEKGETLGGQVHSHPTKAYHSSTDDHFPLATLLGAISVVIPDFAKHAPGDLEEWAWYRLKGYDEWVPAGKETIIEFE